MHQGKALISFADRQWEVKQGDYPRGPGANFFGYEKNNLYLDWRGNLHLRLHQEEGKWYCVEINSLDTLGYGSYQFKIESRFSAFDPKMVLGLFTWDHHSFETQANSELDIEFSRWNYPLASSIMHYSVHPIALERLHLERSYASKRSAQELDGRSLHIIEWRDTSVNFYSYRGYEAVAEAELDHWHYSFQNPARQKSIAGKRSDAITVPKPGGGTQVHINLWILGPKKELDIPPPEVILRDFKFEPY